MCKSILTHSGFYLEVSDSHCEINIQESCENSKAFALG